MAISTAKVIVRNRDTGTFHSNTPLRVRTPDAGCALTSAAMVMAYYGVDTDPQRLNDAIGRNGYDVNHYIKWHAVRECLPR